MSYLLKRDSTWFESVPLSDTSSVISLLSGDGRQVDVPAMLLLATSPLVRTILSTDHAPPAFMDPVISLPSVAGDVLLVLATMLATGMAIMSAEKKIEIIEAFKMLRIEFSPSDLQFQSDIATDLAQDSEQDSVENPASTFDMNCNENILKIKSECLDSDTGNEDIEDFEDFDPGQYITNGIVKVEQGTLHSLKEETTMSEENVPKILLESVCSLQNENSKFYCVLCPKKYDRNEELRRHIISVHDPVHCYLCDKDFKNDHFRRHIQAVHEGKPFFTYKSSLKIHVQTVHEMINVHCLYCGKNIRKNNLWRHIEAVHKN
eukprot:GFUD01028004.1.p1 GENE.GFUD01028004.1~~GFUD01028004.1.p1  ORF type:complete len:319 (+),score=59.93 GFUD01028004.1:30-986(+)